MTEASDCPPGMFGRVFINSSSGIMIRESKDKACQSCPLNTYNSLPGQTSASACLKCGLNGDGRPLYTLDEGEDSRIREARDKLNMDGGAAMSLLRSLVDFNPEKRATAFDVLNSKFIVELLEESNNPVDGAELRTFHAFSSAQ